MRQGMWSHRDIAKFLDLGKSATNQVISSADFPAPVVGDQRYRRYIPDDVVAWALERADAQATERRQILLREERPEDSFAASAEGLADGGPLTGAGKLNPMSAQVVGADGVPPIVFALMRDRRGKVFYVPDRLPTLALEKALATVVLPRWIDWSPGGVSRPLADRSRRLVAYQLVLNEGTPADIINFIDGALLVELWDDLMLPEDIRAAWAPVVRAWAPSAA